MKKKIFVSTVLAIVMLFSIVFLQGCTAKQKARITELEEQLQKVQTENENLTNEKATLEQERDSLKQEKAEITEKVDRITELWEQLEEKLKEVNTELEKQRQEAKAKDNLIADLQKQLQTQSERATDLEVEMKKLTAFVDNLREKFDF